MVGMMKSAPDRSNADELTPQELRQNWVASEIHQEVWGAMETMLSTPNYTVILFEVI